VHQLKSIEGPLFSAEELIEALSCGVALINDHGLIDVINARFAIMTGYSAQNLVGQSAQVLFGSQSLYLDFMSRAEDNNESNSELYGLRLQLLCSDGCGLPVVSVRSRLENANGSWMVIEFREFNGETPESIVSWESLHEANDVDTKFSASLAESEQRFRLAFEGSMAPMVSVIRVESSWPSTALIAP
jgi:PAS domain-containing protein